MPELQINDATDSTSLEQLATSMDTILADVAEPDADSPPSTPESPAPQIEEPEVASLDFDADLADLPLIPPLLPDAIALVQANAQYEESEVRDAILSLLVGNIMISGPPGTGKTLLARKLAQAYNATLIESTANAEWSVYDVIGSERIKGNGTTEPKLGIVTRAVLQCYSTIATQVADSTAPQAVWLLIDEINRADIDRAFGALFTAFSAGEGGEFTLDFVEPTQVVPIPARFRILATLNSYDTRFVNGMSAALRRRFSRVVVRPPQNEANNRIPANELNICLAQAQNTLANVRDYDTASAVRQSIEPYKDNIAQVFGAFRSFEGNKGIPVGAAQIIDTCRFLFVLASYSPITSEPQFWGALDNALAARLTNSLESDAIFNTLDSKVFPAAFKQSFPAMSMTIGRIESFLSGND